MGWARGYGWRIRMTDTDAKIRMRKCGWGSITCCVQRNRLTLYETQKKLLMMRYRYRYFPSEYNTFATVLLKGKSKWLLPNIKVRSHEETAKTLDTKTANANESVMFAKQKFDGNCLKFSRKGHKSSECLSKTEEWCSNCRNKSHGTKNCRKKKAAAKTAVEKTAPRDIKQHEDK